MVEHGNLDPPRTSVWSKLVVRPLPEELDRSWTSFVVMTTIAMALLETVGMVLMLLELRPNWRSGCVDRPRVGVRFQGLFWSSNVLLGLALLVFLVFCGRFALLLRRQRGFRSYGLYVSWFMLRSKMIFVSIVTLLLLVVIPPFIASYRAVLPMLAALVVISVLDYSLVFHSVPPDSRAFHFNAVRFAVAPILVMTVAVFLKLAAEINACGASYTIFQALSLTTASTTLSLGMFTLAKNKVRAPFRPAPVLLADNVRPAADDGSAEGLSILLFRDRVKVAPRFFSISAIIQRSAEAASGVGAGRVSADEIGPAALDALAIHKKFAAEAVPDHTMTEGLLEYPRSVLASHVILKLALAAVLFVRAVWIFVRQVSLRANSTCVRDFNTDFLDLPPLVIGVVSAAGTAVGCWLRPGSSLDGRVSKLGCLPSFARLFAYFVRAEHRLLLSLLIWFSFELADWVISGSTPTLSSSLFSSLVFHCVVGPLLLVQIFYQHIIFSPFPAISRVHHLVCRLALLCMALDVLLLYIKLFMSRTFPCDRAQTSSRLVVTRLVGTLGGFCTVSLFKLYINQFLHQARPPCATGSRTKFAIIENIQSFSESPQRRRDLLKPTPSSSSFSGSSRASPRPDWDEDDDIESLVLPSVYPSPMHKMVSIQVTLTNEPGGTASVMHVLTPVLRAKVTAEKPSSILNFAGGDINMQRSISEGRVASSGFVSSIPILIPKK